MAFARLPNFTYIRSLILKKMAIIIDRKIPQIAKQRLSTFGDLIELQTTNIVYPSISGHPDVFFCLIKDKLIIAPNLPKIYFDDLKNNGIDFLVGEKKLGLKYPETAIYNAVFSEGKIIHNFRYTDSKITDYANGADLIHINQGYARCNLIPLMNGCFITSDLGIKRTLSRYKMEVFFISPEEILLPGHKNGFIGGCCGTYKNKFFVIGQLDKITGGDKMKAFIKNCGFELIELYDGQLFDGGGILFC
jgi:Family of unknown function (DUF6873)